MTKATDARGWLIAALAALGLGLALFSLTIGPAGLSGERVIAAMFGGGDAIDRAIVIDLRLPRALLALLVGAMLGIGGAALQGYLRNPLAEPSVLGASNMAALGAEIGRASCRVRVCQAV